MQRLFSYLLMLAGLLCAVFATAGPPAPPTPGGPFRTIEVRLVNGATISAGATDYLNISEDSVLTVGSGLSRLEYPLSQVAGWTIVLQESITVAADGPTTDSLEPRFALLADRLTVCGLAPGAAVIVTAADGAASISQRADATGQAEVCLNEIAPGVYVAAAGGRSFKFIRR